MAASLRSLTCLASGLLASVAVFAAQGAIAAEQIVLRYGILQESLPVGELSEFSRTGTPSPSLQAYLALANANPQQVRSILIQEIPISPKLLDQALNHGLGHAMLDKVGEAIRTPTGDAHREALRSALVLSASNDKKLSLMEVIQNYPAREVYVEGDRLMSAYTRISKLAQSLQGVMEQIELVCPQCK